MKIIRIILLGLIAVGVVLLVTQKFWLPSLVTMIVPPVPVATSTVVMTPPPVVGSKPDSMAGWQWVLSDVSPQGTQFSYPNPLPTTYVTAEAWPPQVTMTAADFVCNEGQDVEADGLITKYKRETIAGHVYCVGVGSEGAAGSTFTSYDYATAQGDFLTRVTFTLRTPQCLNYDEPSQSACKLEQAQFDAGALADRIASSLTMQ